MPDQGVRLLQPAQWYGKTVKHTLIQMQIEMFVVVEINISYAVLLNNNYKLYLFFPVGELED